MAETMNRSDMEEQERESDIDQNGSNSGTKISDEEEQILSNAYYNPRSPVAFSGIKKIYKYLKMKGIETIKQKKLMVEQARGLHFSSFC